MMLSPRSPAPASLQDDNQLRSLSVISTEDLGIDDLQQVDSQLANWGVGLMRAGNLGGGTEPDTGSLAVSGGSMPSNFNAPRLAPASGEAEAARPIVLYRACGANGLTVRAGVELASPTVLYYARGTVFEVLEQQLSREGRTRLRTPDGWVSERSAVDSLLIASPVSAEARPSLNLLRGKFARSCEGTGTAAAGITALASARLAEAMPRWFGDERGSGGSGGGHNCICGSLALRGAVEGKPQAVQEALRRALEEVIGPAAGDHVAVSVSGGRQGPPPARGEEPCTDFAFEVSVPDLNDRAPVLEVLELEAQCGGARRLLPNLASALSLSGGRLSVRLEILGAKQLR